LRFAVFGGWFGSGNLGDDAILIGLRKVLERVFPRVEIVTLSTDPAHTRRVCGSYPEGLRRRSCKSDKCARPVKTG